MNPVKLAMVSAFVRRDQNDPLRFLERIAVTHFYRLSPYHDMKAEDFDDRLVHYHSPADLYLRLTTGGFDLIQNVEPFDIMLFPYFLTVARAARHKQVPMIVVTCENRPLDAKFTRPVALAMRYMLRPYLRQARLIIYLNHGSWRNLESCGTAPHNAVHLMYGAWGVDIDEFSPKGPVAAFPIDAGFKLLFVGRVAAAKGIFDLLDAVSLLRKGGHDLGLLIVGAGPDKQRAMRRAAEPDLAPRVSFTGIIKNSEIASYYRAADLFVSPARTTRMWEEQIGMTNIQSMGCAVPVVSTRSGAIPEFVEDGVVGLLVPERDVPALASAIETLIVDRELLSKLGQGARARVLEAFDARHNVRKVEDYICTTLCA